MINCGIALILKSSLRRKEIIYLNANAVHSLIYMRVNVMFIKLGCINDKYVKVQEKYI